MGNFVALTASDGRRFDAWLVRPDQPNGRGLIVLPEVYNVNPWVRGNAQRYADAGFTVLVPDLFWRQEAGVHLDYDQPDRARAQGDDADIDAIVSDIGPAAAWLRNALGSASKVGVVGFCIGGRLALLAGVRQPIDLVVAYYGVKLDRHLDELARLRIPAVLHYGDQDPWVPPAEVHAVEDVLAPLSNVQIHHYEAGHGFARNGYPPFNEKANDLAWTRTLALLRDA